MRNRLTPEFSARMREIGTRSGTPLYVYFAPLLTTRYQAFRAALPDEFEVLYSAKANPNPDLAAHLKSLGAGVDVSSQSEFEVARKAGFGAADISFVGPGKSSDEVQACLSFGSYLVIESLQELEEALAFCRQAGLDGKFILRLNPRTYAGTRGQKVSAAPSQFGLDEDSVIQAIAKIKDAAPTFLKGFHFHTQSGYHEGAIVADNYARFLALSLELKSAYDLSLSLVNFGGGIAHPDYPEQADLDLHDFSLRLREIVGSATFSRLGRPRLVIESGRYLLRGCGFYLTKVLYKKKSYGKTYLVVDGGFHQNMAATGFGFIPRRHFRIHALTDNGSGRERVHVAGRTCYQVDLLAEDVELPQCEPGQILCIENAGAYGYSFSPLHFLSHALPQEIFLEA